MNEMKKAHNIRKAAAEKWNCKVSEIVFSECLKMAWRGEELKEKSFEEKVLSSKEVKKFNVWEKGNVRRIYITLKGVQRSFRGDNNFKVYIEDATLKTQSGKGITSNLFDESLEAFQNYVEQV